MHLKRRWHLTYWLAWAVSSPMSCAVVGPTTAWAVTSLMWGCDHHLSHWSHQGHGYHHYRDTMYTRLCFMCIYSNILIIIFLLLIQKAKFHRHYQGRTHHLNHLLLPHLRPRTSSPVKRPLLEPIPIALIFLVIKFHARAMVI